MLKLRHTLKPEFGNGGGVSYKLIYRPFATDLAQAIREKSAEAVAGRKSGVATPDFTLSEMRGYVRDHLVEATGLVDEDDKPVPSAQAIDELMQYPGFVREVFLGIYAGSVVSAEEDPTSGH